MQIVINIPDEIYEIQDYLNYFGCTSEMLEDTIDSGALFDTIIADIKAEIAIATNGISHINKDIVFEIIDKHTK